MRPTRVLLVSTVLAFPAIAPAGMIASAEFLTQFCAQQSSQEGEFSASISATCGGDSASAAGNFDGVNLFQLSASGSKTVASGLGQVSATASMEYPLLVTNTDQPGFLRIHWIYNHNLQIIDPGLIQVTSVTIAGTTRGGFDVGNFGAIYLPYTPGVPVLLHASATGRAGASDVIRQGTFQADLSVYLLGVVPEILTDELQNPNYIPGAAIVTLPEPAAWSLALAGLVLILMAAARRGRIVIPRGAQR